MVVRTCLGVVFPYGYAGGRSYVGIRRQWHRDVNVFADLNRSTLAVKQLCTDCCYCCQVRPAIFSSLKQLHRFKYTALSIAIFHTASLSYIFIWVLYGAFIMVQIFIYFLYRMTRVFRTCVVWFQSEWVREWVHFILLSGCC